MTSEDVRQFVLREVAGDWTRTNAHGCDLRRCLVTPALHEYEDASDPPRTLSLWLVLEEIPEDRSGYKIVYDERAGMFGLVTPGSDKDVLLGYYGSFLDTYAGM
jgi:hypothetical protein